MDSQAYLNEIRELVKTSLRPQERISLLRRVLESLFKQLTGKYGIVIYHLQPKIAYFCQQEHIDKTTTDLLQELRVFCNRVVHNQIPNPTDNNQKYCVKILSEFIASTFNVEATEEIKRFYISEKAFAPLLPLRARRYEEISEISGFIKSFTRDVKRDFKERDFIEVVIENDDLGVITVRLTKAGSDDIITELANTAWEYAEIMITDVSFDKEGGRYYSTPKTLAILEPSFVIDVKQISECNEFIGGGRWDIDPGSYQRKKFEEIRSNEHITKGYLLGSILDEIATDTPFNFIEKADEFFKSSAVSTLSLKKEKGDGITDRIKIETQPQEENIKTALSRFNNHKVSIEPTFLSVKYGIQGRIDALYENKTRANEKTVVELKSGNPAYSNPQHNMQTALYDLLLKSTYPDRTGQSYVLYSRDATSPLRLVNNEDNVFFIQRKAMQIRNKIVSDEFNIAKGEMLPVYEAIEGLELNPVESLYFDGFCKFICNEIKTAKEKHRNTLLSDGNDKGSSKYLSNLAIMQVTDDFQIKLSINPDGQLLFDLPDFKENDYVMLFPVEDDGTTNPLHHQILKSTIREISDQYIAISLVNKQLNKEYFQQYKRWAICQDLRESTLKRLYQQIYSLIKAPLEKRQLLLSLEKEPAFSGVTYTDTKRLSVLQNEIVKQALSSKDYFIIQGPPGTGKTKFILTEIVKNLYSSEKVVVIAYTNQAVSEICQELYEAGIDFLQLGGKNDRPFSLNKISAELPLNDLLRKIESTNVIVSTQHTLFSNLDLLSAIHYKTLLVDEASQLLEPQLVGILTKFERFILIGDEKQLPAISLQEETTENMQQELREISLYKFSESLFYRLLLNAKRKNWNCIASLKEQGRMHADIAEFPSRHYYQNQLQVIFEEQKNTDQLFSLQSTDHIERALALKRVLFIPSERDAELFRNDSEQRMIKEFLRIIESACKAKKIKIVFKSRSSDELSIGVITPFRKQITNIKRIIPEHLRSVILVDSIEKFQGSERDIIFYSIAVNNRRQIEKLQSLVTIDDIEIDRKLNVALTRAKRHLIITGTKPILMQDKQYKNLIEDIEDKGGLIQLTF